MSLLDDANQKPLLNRRRVRLAGACLALCAGVVLSAPHLSLARSSVNSATETRIAQAPASSKVRELYDSGKASLANYDYAAAYRAFSTAFRMSPTADSLYFLATLAAAQGNRIGAEDLLRRYLSDPTLASSTEAMERQAEAQKLLAQVQAGTPAESGEVSVLNDRAAFVFVDERLVGQVPLSQPLLVPVGTHKIAIEQGNQRQEAELTVLSGRTIEMRVNRTTGAIIVSLPPALLLLPSYVGLPPEALSRFELSVAQAVRRERLAPLRKDLALQRFPAQAACIERASCQAELATKLEADYALLATVEAGGQQKPNRYKLAFSLLDARVVELSASDEKICEPCTIEQAVARGEEMLEGLLGRGMARARGALELSTNPPGAEVLIGERKLGETPYKHALFAGTYALTVRKPGFLPQEQSVRIDAEQTVTREVVLQPTPGAVPEVAKTSTPSPTVQRGPRPLWRIVGGAVAVAGGIVMIGIGAGGLAVNNQCIDMPASGGECERVYDTGALGGGLVGAGAALTIGGAVLLALPGPRRTQ